jgi:hypothetical protein
MRSLPASVTAAAGFMLTPSPAPRRCRRSRWLTRSLAIRCFGGRDRFIRRICGSVFSRFWRHSRQPIGSAETRLRYRVIFGLCCTEAGHEGTSTQLLQPIPLFNRYRHGSGVRAPALGSGWHSEGNLDRLCRCAIEGHRQSPVCIARSTSRRFPQFVGAGFPPGHAATSVIIRRWRSRCVGAVSAEAVACRSVTRRPHSVHKRRSARP